MQNSVYVSNTVKKVKWERIPSDRVNSVIIHFDFSEEWNGLLCVAQFSQGGKCYSQVIDEDGSCSLPVELTKGYVKLGVFGTKEDGSAYRATTIPFEFSISESGFCSTAETPIPPTPDLYDQLINRFQKGYIADKIFNPLSEIAQSGIAVEQAKQQAITESANYTDTKVGEIPQIEVDQTFNSLSANAQSGVAVKEATEKAHVGEGTLSVQFYGKAEKYGSISIGARSVCQQGNGVAIGTDSKAEGYRSGVATGNRAKVMGNGCAAGNRATAVDGGAVGLGAVTEQGGAVGVYAQSQNGFAGGVGAKSTAQHSIQLGTGTNAEEGTMCVSNGTTNYKLLEADGTIPPERLPEIGTTDYADLTNKPKINGVELVGDKTSVELGLATTEYVNQKSNEALTSAKEYTDGKPWELIETIIVGADTPAIILRSKEPNGTPYNFKKIRIKMKCPAGATSSSYVFVNGLNVHYIRTITSESAEWYSFFKGKFENNEFDCVASYSGGNKFTPVQIIAPAAGFDIAKGKSVNKIKLQCTSNFLENTEIKIEAVRL